MEEIIRTNINKYKVTATDISAKSKGNKNDNIHKNEVQNIGFGFPIEFPSQRKKIIQIGS